MSILTPTQEAQIRATIAKAVEVAIKNIPMSDQSKARADITRRVTKSIGLADKDHADTDHADAFKGQ